MLKCIKIVCVRRQCCRAHNRRGGRVGSYRKEAGSPAPERHGQHVVEDVDVLAEPVEHAADGRAVEEADGGRAQHAGQQRRVQRARRRQRAQVQRQRRHRHRHHCHSRTTTPLSTSATHRAMYTASRRAHLSTMADDVLQLQLNYILV